jgi:predicted nucleic acid-binding protein
MAMMLANAIFIDTNVLVYASIASAPLHQHALQAILGHERSGIALWVSRQVLREYVAVVTRPQTFSQPIAAAMVATQIRAFEQRFRVADDTGGVTTALLFLMQQVALGGKQVHDANIVATMHVLGVTHLLTHNTADFARFAHLIVVMPLVAGP